MATGVKKSQKAFIRSVIAVQQTGPLNAGATAWIELPYNLPTGYSPISIYRLYTTGTGVYVYHFGLSGSENKVIVAIRNGSSAATTYTVDATVGCIKTS